MAIDPNILEKGIEVAKGVTDIAKEGIREYGKKIAEENATTRHKTKEKNTTIRHETEEENRTERHRTDAVKENRETEIHATKNTMNHTSDNMHKVTDSALDTIRDTTEKLTETTDKSMRHMKDSANENAGNILNISKYIHKQLMENNKANEGYQKLLWSAQKQVSAYKIREEIHREVSQKLMNFAELAALYKEKIANKKNDIRRKEEKLKPLQEALNKIEIDIKISNSEYTKFNIDFEKQIHVLKKLNEYKNDMDYEKYLENYKREENVLVQFINDISHKELQLLDKENARLHKVEELAPMLKIWDDAKISLEYLEEENTKVQSLGMIKITNPQLEDRNADKLDTSEVIDVQPDESTGSDTLLMK